MMRLDILIYPIAWASVLSVMLPASAVKAQASGDPERPVAEWIKSIEQKTKRFYANERPELAALRLIAGWSMMHDSDRSHQAGPMRDRLSPLNAWLDKDGYRILGMILDDKLLATEDEPYCTIAAGLYLRAGLDHEKAVLEDRAFSLDLDKAKRDRKACIDFRTRVHERGQNALRKGYLTGTLNRSDVQAIHFYRIAQGQRGVGEAFLPVHLGLHPLGDGKFSRSASGGHGLEKVIQANLGKPFYDFRLRRLENVLQSADYSDKLDTDYHLTFALRPEGVLEFLRFVQGYEPCETKSGIAAVRLKPEHLELRPGDKPDDSVRLRDRVGQKPVVLYLNDPIDDPVTEQFPAFETIYQAYGAQVDCWFVAIDIHDWYYSGMEDLLSAATPGKFPNIHSYNQAERARKVKNRYLQSPQVTFPCLIGDDWQSLKNFYGTGGGANHWLVIDRNGLIAEYVGNQDGNLNCLETAIRRVLGNNGAMAGDSKAQFWNNPESAPNLIWPSNKRLRLHDAEVVSIDQSQRELVVKRAGMGPNGTVTVRLKAFARVTRDEALVDIKEIKPGLRVAIDFYLDEYIDTARAEEKPLKEVNYGTWRRQYEIGNQRLQTTLLGTYGVIRHRWYLDEAVEANAIPARGIRVLNTAQVGFPTREPAVIWLSGRVTAVDAKTRQIRVQRAPISAEAAKGFAFYQHAKRQGNSVALTDVARRRMDEVQKWLDDPRGEVVVLADDAVDFCLNGEFRGGCDSIAVGDFVGVRYYPQSQQPGRLVPHTIRISKPL